MKAVVSGRACVALLIDGETLNSIHYEEMDRLVTRRPEEFRFLFGGVNDLDWIDEVASVDDVRDRLADAVDSTEALNLVLYLCDDRLSAETLQSAAMELEELIVYPEIVAELERVLFAKPLPESVDVAAGLTACDVTDSHAMAAFLERLLDRQPAITTVRMAWHAIPIERFGQVERRTAEAICLRFGLFRGLVDDFTDTETSNLTQFRLASSEVFSHELPIAVEWLDDWSLAIRQVPIRRKIEAVHGRAQLSTSRDPNRTRLAREVTNIDRHRSAIPRTTRNVRADSRIGLGSTSVASLVARRRVLKRLFREAKGSYGGRKNLLRTVKETSVRNRCFAYRDRRNRK